MVWTPRAGEDRLLHAYWQGHAWSLLYREVSVGGAKRWSGSTARRIDGVVVAPSSVREARNNRAFRRDLRAGVEWREAELIEVKRGLSEEVIGQALAGRWLFEEEVGRPRGIAVARNVVLYQHEDPAMRWAVDQLKGVDAERVMVPETNQCMKSRLHYHLRGPALARLVADRRQAPGLVVTRVPVAGERSGVAAWAGSAESHVRFVRIVDSEPHGIVAFEGRAWFAELAAGHELEVVVPRRAMLTRGSIGVAYVHAMMLAAQYGVARPRLAVVCERGDPALEAACSALGVEVRFVPRGVGVAGEEGDEEE